MFLKLLACPLLRFERPTLSSFENLCACFSLVSRQKEWARQDEERRLNTPDPDLPPGHRVMPKPEQEETLKKLRSCKQSFLFYSRIIIHHCEDWELLTFVSVSPATFSFVL